MLLGKALKNFWKSLPKAGVVVAAATEVLKRQGLPLWATLPKTKYFLLLYVPEQAILLLPTQLKLRRAGQRLYGTNSRASIGRLIIAQHRDNPREGIVDAFFLMDRLMVFSGDLKLHQFPIESISALRVLNTYEIPAFEIDPDARVAGAAHLVGCTGYRPYLPPKILARPGEFGCER